MENNRNNSANDFARLAEERILNPKPKRKILRAILPVTATLAAVAGLIYLGWNAYEESLNTPIDVAKVPVVKADGKPYKMEAENQPDESADNSDKKVYDAISPTKTPNDDDDGEIKVVTQAEQPIVRAPVKTPGGKSAAEQPAKDNDQENASAQIHTNSQESDDEAVKPIETASAEKPAEAKPLEASATAPTVIKESPQASNEKPAEAKPAETSASKETQENKDSGIPKKVKSDSENPKALAKSIKIQLGAFKSSDEAHQQWAHLSRKYSKNLGGLKPVVEKAEIKNKGTFYRLQAGPVKSESAARALCKSLSTAKQGCFIVNPKS